MIGVFNVPHEKPLRLCFCDTRCNPKRDGVHVASETVGSARFDDWSAIHFNLVLESAQRVADRFLNGSGLISSLH